MNVRNLRALVAGGLVVLAVAGWWWWRQPERRVLRQLDELMARLEKDGEEGQLDAGATARGVGALFAPGFYVRATPYEAELSDPQELMGAVLRFRGSAQRIAIDTTEREAHLQASPPTAVLTFVAAVTMDQGRGPASERWRVRTLWIEDGGEWRIAELELVERLEGGLDLPF
jgi:hypothetical protein